MFEFWTEDSINLHRFRSNVIYLGLNVINSLEFWTRNIQLTCKPLQKDYGAKKTRDKKKSAKVWIKLDGRWTKRKIVCDNGTRLHHYNNRHFNTRWCPCSNICLFASQLLPSYYYSKRYNLHVITKATHALCKPLINGNTNYFIGLYGTS